MPLLRRRATPPPAIATVLAMARRWQHRTTRTTALERAADVAVHRETRMFLFALADVEQRDLTREAIVALLPYQPRPRSVREARFRCGLDPAPLFPMHVVMRNATPDGFVDYGPLIADHIIAITRAAAAEETRRVARMVADRYRHMSKT